MRCCASLSLAAQCRRRPTADRRPRPDRPGRETARRLSNSPKVPRPTVDGNVYFSDIPAEKIYKVDTTGKLTTFREKSNNVNGTMVNAAGELVGCEMQGQVTVMGADGQVVRTVAKEYEGKRFNAPNDLVIDSAGGVYFTDPHFRAPTPLPQGVTAVYYAAADGKVTRLIDDLKAPNGVILSPDETNALRHSHVAKPR